MDQLKGVHIETALAGVPHYPKRAKQLHGEALQQVHESMQRAHDIAYELCGANIANVTSNAVVRLFLQYVDELFASPDMYQREYARFEQMLAAQPPAWKRIPAISALIIDARLADAVKMFEGRDPGAHAEGFRVRRHSVLLGQTDQAGDERQRTRVITLVNPTWSLVDAGAAAAKPKATEHVMALVRLNPYIWAKLDGREAQRFVEALDAHRQNMLKMEQQGRSRPLRAVRVFGTAMNIEQVHYLGNAVIK